MRGQRAHRSAASIRRLSTRVRTLQSILGRLEPPKPAPPPFAPGKALRAAQGYGEAAANASVIYCQRQPMLCGASRSLPTVGDHVPPPSTDFHTCPKDSVMENIGPPALLPSHTGS